MNIQRRCATAVLSGKLVNDERLREDTPLMGHCFCMFGQYMLRSCVTQACRVALPLPVPLWLCHAAGDFKCRAACSADGRGMISKNMVQAWNIHDAARPHMLPHFPRGNDSVLRKSYDWSINLCWLLTARCNSLFQRPQSRQVFRGRT